MVRKRDYLKEVSKCSGMLQSRGIFLLFLLALEAHKDKVKFKDLMKRIENEKD